MPMNLFVKNNQIYINFRSITISISEDKIPQNDYVHYAMK